MMQLLIFLTGRIFGMHNDVMIRVRSETRNRLKMLKGLDGNLDQVITRLLDSYENSQQTEPILSEPEVLNYIFDIKKRLEVLENKEGQLKDVNLEVLQKPKKIRLKRSTSSKNTVEKVERFFKNNPNASYSDAAKKLGITKQTIGFHYNNLVKEGILPPKKSQVVENNESIVPSHTPIFVSTDIGVIYTPDEAAAFLRIPEKNVIDLLRAGKIKGFKAGRF